MLRDGPGTGEQTYYVDGRHCAACEIVVEKKLIELDNVRSVDASTSSSVSSSSTRAKRRPSAG